MVAHPFLKWVGGKTQLLSHILPLLPKHVGTYYETFTGGGALFWALAEEGRFERAVLNDLNPELVTTYEVIRDAPQDLIRELQALKHNRETFEILRGQVPSELGAVHRAARMIYLNKTGFNGLYRVNKAGKFNVPFGDYPNPKICDTENILACSSVLKRNVTILNGDFAEAVKDATAGDAVYFDPPYVPVSKTANFTSYTKEGFGPADQARLATLFRALHERGVYAMLSNADSEDIWRLYDGFDIHVAPARRAINSKGSARGPVMEVIVTSAPPPSDDGLSLCEHLAQEA